MDGIRKKIDYILKHNLIVQILYKKVLSAVFRFIGLFVRTDDKLILFSGHGRKYNDSPRSIYEYMINREEYKDFNYVWALEEPDKVEILKGTKIKADTMKYFITALKAKYWVTCVNIERGLHFKKKNTIFLNTWHGVSINKVGNAVSGRKDFNCSNVDIFCYSAEFEKNIIIRDFNTLDASMFPSGLPRNDELYYLRKDEIFKLREKLNIPHNKKVILYAPTWRDSTDNGLSYQIVPPIDWNEWEKELGNEYVVLLRTHAYTNKLMGVKFNDFVRDASSYPIVNNLLAVADIIISDYSSIMFDFSVLGRPIICFGYDYDEYNKYRGFYFDLDKEMPSGVIREEKKVLHKIKYMDFEAECKKTIDLRDKYVNYGGHATEMCVKRLIEER